MVVTRKAPSAPLAASRTNSSQPVPKVKKTQVSTPPSEKESLQVQSHAEDAVRK